MKTNDIIVAAFPKSGVSYLGYLLVAARAHYNRMDIRPNFFNIDWLLIDDSKMRNIPHAEIWKDGMGDFIKTHQTRDKAGAAPSAIVLIREPFATLRSYYHFRRQFAGERVTPQAFLTGPHGISAWLGWVASWTSGGASQSLHFVDYDKLMKDTNGQVASIFRALGFEDYEDGFSVQEAVDWATLDNMRLLESQFSANNPVYQNFNLEFIRPGTERAVDGFGEELRPVIDRQCKAAYEAVVSKLP